MAECGGGVWGCGAWWGRRTRTFLGRPDDFLGWVSSALIDGVNAIICVEFEQFAAFKGSVDVSGQTSMYLVDMFSQTFRL